MISKAVLDKDYLELKKAVISYEIVPEESAFIREEKDLDIITEALKNVGVNLTVKKKKLTITIDPDKYIIEKKRFAGKEEIKVVFPDNRYGAKGEYIKYSDILIMLNDINNTELIKYLGMSRKTYYAHKKKLVESDYYKMIDKNKENTENYLKSEELSQYDWYF